MAATQEMRRHATLSTCLRYRYSLLRVWDPTKPLALFVGLNPSTADALRDDPTIRRCIRFAQLWGMGGMAMANLFGFRSRHPSNMLLEPDPVGPDNDWHLWYLANRANITVACWGAKGSHMNRGPIVHRWLYEGIGDRLRCLAFNGDGTPGHPLYLPGNLAPQPFPCFLEPAR